MTELKADAVFEGGGVKGIALVGAIAVTEEKGYSFENVAGTSAGAIVASLVAAGYSAVELGEIMRSAEYSKFLDKDVVDKIPLLGPALSLGFEKGIYEGKYFEEWLRGHLAKKGKRDFGDLVMDQYKDDPRYRYRLRVITADISLGKLLVLPQDIADYGQAPDSLDIARAVRMSMSIPFFFEPVILQHRGHPSYVVDGGVLSNFPVWLFDDETGEPAWPTFGYKLVDPSDGKPAAITGPVSLLGALFSTMIEAHDARYIQDQHFARTIAIPTLGVRTTDFDIAPARRDALYESGRQAAQEFFETWDFEHYKRTYRSKPPAERRERITAGA